MTSEQRLDRLERIAKLMASAGLRARRTAREQQEKINIIIDAQIKNDERFARLAETQTELVQSHAEQNDKINIIIDAQIKNDERFARLAEAQAENEKRFAKLADHQDHTDQQLDALIDIIRDKRNGKSNS